MLLLQLFKRYRGHVEVIAAVLVFVVLFMNWMELQTTRANMKAAEVALQHPTIAYRTRTVTMQGPVRTKTVYIEKASGDKETTTDEMRYGEVVDTGQESTSSPAAGLDFLKASNQRLDRWLIGGAVRVDQGMIKPDTLIAGYSFKNRIDLTGQLTRNDGTEARVAVVTRW